MVETYRHEVWTDDLKRVNTHCPNAAKAHLSENPHTEVVLYLQRGQYNRLREVFSHDDFLISDPEEVLNCTKAVEKVVITRRG